MTFLSQRTSRVIKLHSYSRNILVLIKVMIFHRGVAEAIISRWNLISLERFARPRWRNVLNYPWPYFSHILVDEIYILPCSQYSPTKMWRAGGKWSASVFAKLWNISEWNLRFNYQFPRLSDSQRLRMLTQIWELQISDKFKTKQKQFIVFY